MLLGRERHSGLLQRCHRWRARSIRQTFSMMCEFWVATRADRSLHRKIELLDCPEDTFLRLSHTALLVLMQLSETSFCMKPAKRFHGRVWKLSEKHPIEWILNFGFACYGSQFPSNICRGIVNNWGSHHGKNKCPPFECTALYRYCKRGRLL